MLLPDIWRDSASEAFGETAAMKWKSLCLAATSGEGAKQSCPGLLPAQEPGTAFGRLPWFIPCEQARHQHVNTPLCEGNGKWQCPDKKAASTQSARHAGCGDLVLLGLSLVPKYFCQYGNHSDNLGPPHSDMSTNDYCLTLSLSTVATPPT